jgi:Xaa-Pro aminopeptidase
MRSIQAAVLVMIVLFSFPAPLFAQYTDQTAFDELGGAQEFARRRAELEKLIKPGVALLFARMTDPEGTHYREDNDFYYYTGIADLGAVLIIDANTDRTILFEPDQTDLEKQFFGANLGALSREAQARLGFSSVEPIKNLLSTLVLLTARAESPFWVRLGFPDTVDGDRTENGLFEAMNQAHPFGEGAERDRIIPIRLRERYPQVELRDLVPAINRMRNVKTDTEIAIMRRNGRISADGIRAAIAHAAPGMYEYQIEADAAYRFTTAGAQGVAYPAVVASGPNVNVWHYFRNRRKIEPNDLVVLDFAADLNHLTCDITRTFNVSGAFTAEQTKWYSVDLEAETAVISFLRPGHTYEEAAEEGRRVFQEHGIDEQWTGFPGHFVGLATHDAVFPTADAASLHVFLPSGPVKPGQVVTVEPGIGFPDKNLLFRVEDTVLITTAAPEVLTSGGPKTIAEVQKLVGSERIK